MSTQQRMRVVRDSDEQTAAQEAQYRAELVRARALAEETEAAGVPALKRLLAFATEHSTGGSRRAGQFLAGLYNGGRFPFDLTNLRALDNSLFEDCMLVLRMDARVTRQEVHCYFEGGGRRFEEMIKRYGLEQASD